MNFRNNFIITRYRIISESNKKIVAIESCAVFARDFHLVHFCGWNINVTFSLATSLRYVFALSVSFLQLHIS